MTADTIAARHAFTTRAGGVSEGGFASLNLGFGRGDPDANVLENYRRLGAAIASTSAAPATPGRYTARACA